jgi:hypothetical protein
MIVADWVYPAIEGLSVDWIATIEHINKGIAVIRIPRQEEARKPFLLYSLLDEKKRSGVLFGYVKRRDDKNDHLSLEELQKALQAGFHYENRLNQRLDGLETLIKQSSVQASVSTGDGLTTQIALRGKMEQRTLEGGGLDSQRAFVLSAFILESSELKSVFQVSEGAIRQRLEDPPLIREGGWGLRTHGRAKIIKGEFVRVVDYGYKILDLYRDGTLIFGVSAGNNFLAWGTPQEEQRLNPIALVESVYNFLKLYEFVLADLNGTHDKVYIRATFQNLHRNEIQSYLLPNDIQSWMHQARDIHRAPANRMEKTVLVEGAKFSPSAVGFLLLKEIYAWFGIEEENIPYTRHSNGVRTVDTDAIKQL